MVAELQPVVSRHFKDDSAGGVGAKLATLATQSSTHARPPNIPHVHHATASRVVKGEVGGQFGASAGEGAMWGGSKPMCALSEVLWLLSALAPPPPPAS